VFAGAGALSGWLGLPANVLSYAGLFLMPYAALVAYVGTRPEIPRGAAWAVVTCNLIWAVDSAMLLVSGLVTPTALGQSFLIAQAAVVAGLAGLQYIALRRSAAIAA
jgi:hypothetical protein